jgi:hypothetical protein
MSLRDDMFYLQGRINALWMITAADRQPSVYELVEGIQEHYERIMSQVLVEDDIPDGGFRND